MEARNLVQQGNTLKVNLYRTTISENTENPCTLHSPEYVICSSAVFQVRVTVSPAGHKADFLSTKLINSVFVKFAKRFKDDNLHYTIKVTCTVSDKRNYWCFTSDEGYWRLLNNYISSNSSFHTLNLSVEMDMVPGASSFSPLHEDTDLLDFELRGEDGSVHFHKLVLAASSPVIRRMLSGTWRETTEGRVNVPGTSKKTLQSLKNYIYLHTLPDEDIEQLLLLSLYYIMPDLEHRCVYRLLESLTAQNACDLFKFAVKYGVTSLLLRIMACAHSTGIVVEGMSDHFRVQSEASSEGNSTCKD